MAIEYHINQRDELITLTVKGDVSASEACVKIDELLNDNDFNAALPQLIDLRLADIKGSREDLEHFETFLLGEYRPRLQASVAIVINTDWAEEICAQAFWLSCALHRAELFDGWNQACKWLIKREFSDNLVDLDPIRNEPDSDAATAGGITRPIDSGQETEHSQ